MKRNQKREKDENKIVERVNKNKTEEGMNIDNESSHIKSIYKEKVIDNNFFQNKIFNIKSAQS